MALRVLLLEYGGDLKSINRESLLMTQYTEAELRDILDDIKDWLRTQRGIAETDYGSSIGLVDGNKGIVLYNLPAPIRKEVESKWRDVPIGSGEGVEGIPYSM